jgi:hypothetical protein
VIEKLLFDRLTVKTGDGAEPPSNRRASTAALLKVATEALDVGAPRLEETDAVLLAPGGELAKVEGVRLAGKPAVSGEKAGESDSLGLAEHGLWDDDGS